MSQIKGLSANMLRKECDPSSLAFANTSELEPLEDIIGQERAVRAMEFGLKIDTRGYNIFMSGMTGTGKTSYAVNCGKKKLQRTSRCLMIGAIYIILKIQTSPEQ